MRACFYTLRVLVNPMKVCFHTLRVLVYLMRVLANL